MPIVNIPGKGNVSFPDDMTPAQIQQVIETEILPPRAAAPKPRPSIEDTNIIRDIGGSLVAGAGDLLALPGQVYGLATGDFDTVASRAAKAVSEAGQDIKSAGLKEREFQSQARIAEAGKEGVLAEAAQAAKEYATDPNLFFSGAFATIPSLLGGLGTGAVAGKAIRAVAARKATEEAAKTLGRKVAVRTAVGTGAVQQGASVGEQTYERVAALPEETLLQSPKYRELLASGSTPEEARSQMALTAARQAAAVSTAISAATAGVMGGIEKTVLGDAISGGLIKRVSKAGAKEFVQEGTEEGGGKLAENIAVSPADVNADIMQGVGGAIAQGGILGFGVGAPAGIRGGPAAVVPPVVPPVAPPAAEVPPAPVAPAPVTPGIVQLNIPQRGGLVDVEVIGENPETGAIQVGNLLGEGVVGEVQPSQWAEIQTTYAPPVVEAAPVAAAPVTPVPVTPAPVVEPVAEVPVAEVPIAPAPVVPTVEPVAEVPGVAPVIEPAPPVAPVAIEPAPVAPIVEQPPIPVAPVVEQPPVSVAPQPPMGVEPEAPATVELPPPPTINEPTQEFTQQQGKAVGTFKPEFLKAIKGKSAIQVASHVKKNSQAPYIRNIMGRVEGMMKAFESAGVKFNFDVVEMGDRKKGDEVYLRNRDYMLARPAVAGTASRQVDRATNKLSSVSIMLRGPSFANTGVNEETVAHEFIHAVTTSVITNQDKFSPKSRVGQSVKELKKLYSEVVSFQRGVNTGAIDVPPVMRETIARISTSNAFQNEREMLAWGLTNYEFQQVLKAIPIQKTNAFTKFVESVGKMLGIGSGDMNALRRLIELTETLIPVEAAKKSAITEAVSMPQVKPDAQELSVDAMETPAPEPKPALTIEDLLPPARPPGAGNSFSLGATEETRLDRFKRVFVDRMRRMGYVEQQIEKSLGITIPRAFKPTEYAGRFEGRAQERLDQLEKKHNAPIREEITKSGLTPNEVDFYLLARAAKDRNAKILARDPETPNGSSLSDEDADAILANFDAAGLTPKLEKIGKMVDALVKDMLDMRVESGLMTRGEADYLLKMEPHYVPLKGIAAGGDLSVPGDPEPHIGYAGRGASVSPKEYKVAKGRSTLPFSPLANVMSDATVAIIRGERNVVGQSFLKLARSYPSDAWQIFSEGNPERTSDGNAIPMGMMADRYLVVKESGKTYFIKINDPLLKRAVMNLGTQEWSAFNRALGKTIGVATRVLSRSYTTLNPEFAIPNYLRDIEAATFNILAEQDRVDGRLAGKKILKGVLKDTSSFKDFVPILRATIDRTPRTPEEKATFELFQQFKADGGTTGWIMRETPKEVMEKIKSEIDRATAKGGKRGIYATQDGLKKIIEGVENFNSTFENVTRFAVYKHAIDAKLSRNDAASMARNVTVDFNRKGEVGPTLNALYAFFNASVQGNVQLVRSLGSDPRKHGGLTRAQYLALGMVTLGAIQSIMNNAISDDDEDGKSFYDKIPDHEKDRNLIVMYNGREYVKIPLAYGYSLFHSLGSNASEMLGGKMEVGDFALKMMAGAINNFAPLSLSGETIPGLLSSMVPTVAKPFLDLYRNENFFGSPIYNEPFDEEQSKSSVSRYSTPEAYKAIAEFMNNVTGGQGKIAGKVDFPAEGYEYLTQFAIGGAGQFIGRVYDFATEGSETAADVPLGRKIFGEPSKYADLGDFYDRANEMKPIIKQMESSDPAERKALRDKYPTKTNSRVVEAMKVAEKRVREINKQRKALANNENIEDVVRMERKARLDELQRDAYIRFNKIYNQVEGK